MEFLFYILEQPTLLLAESRKEKRMNKRRDINSNLIKDYFDSAVRVRWHQIPGKEGEKKHENQIADKPT